MTENFTLMLRRHSVHPYLALALSLLTLISVFSGTSRADAEAEFDRLDGHGKSGKRVDVVEFEENLEIHVYPKGSLAGLALTVDRKKKNQPVMVIGYRFFPQKKDQLVRRAVLSVPLSDKFKVFRDPKEKDFDKIIVTDRKPQKQWVNYTVERTLASLYPAEASNNLASDDRSEPSSDRAPAHKQVQKRPAPAWGADSPDGGIDENGSIRSNW